MFVTFLSCTPKSLCTMQSAQYAPPMKLANLNGRLVLVDGANAADVEAASDGRFSAAPADAYQRWDELVSAARVWDFSTLEWNSFDADQLGSPSPAPRQIFAIGVNYAAHSDETGIAVPAQPMVFTKFSSSVTGPVCEVELPTDTVDWEVELVAVIGKEAHRVSADAAWDHVAGLTIGQDFSERTSQMAGALPQFSLAKSFPNFAPVGPVLVTTDELPNRDEIRLRASINGETVQDGVTTNMIFSIPTLIQRLSAVCPLLPGDLIFTGTPDGVGMGLTPPRYLAPGDELISEIEGIGSMRQRFVAARSAVPARS